MKKNKVATIKLIPDSYMRGYFNAELWVKGRKTAAFKTYTLRMTAAIAACMKVAKDNGYTVPNPPPAKLPSGLTAEDRNNIADLQERRYQVGRYGDDSGVRSEQREISAKINQIKDAAKARAANGLMGSGVKPLVPLNLNVDR